MFSPGKIIGADSPALRRRVWLKGKMDPISGCFLWTAALSKKRRGLRPVIRVGARGSRMVQVARLVLEWKSGPPPTPAHEAGHTCPAGENELCIHPGHLAWMTRTENEQQKQSYRRGAAAGAVPSEGVESLP